MFAKSSCALRRQIQGKIYNMNSVYNISLTFIQCNGKWIYKPWNENCS